jgi:hypothetical protein
MQVSNTLAYYNYWRKKFYRTGPWSFYLQNSFFIFIVFHFNVYLKQDRARVGIKVISYGGRALHLSIITDGTSSLPVLLAKWVGCQCCLYLLQLALHQITCLASRRGLGQGTLIEWKGSVQLTSLLR